MNAESRSFAPIYHPKAHTLILGTWPSPKSREQGFYYGHPQNRFWPLLARLYGTPVPETIAEKTALIVQNRLALWDTLASCSITGASDASIRDAVPNEIATLCTRVPIRRVLCNGATAFSLYTKFHPLHPTLTADFPTTELAVYQLPSTSPANAAWTMDRLAQAWGAALGNRADFRTFSQQRS